MSAAPIFQYLLYRSLIDFHLACIEALEYPIQNILNQFFDSSTMISKKNTIALVFEVNSSAQVAEGQLIIVLQ